MNAERQIWLMLAFPGENVGEYALRAFAPAKSGKCWYRKLTSRAAAIACKQELVLAGIRYPAAQPGRGKSNVVQFSQDGFGDRLNATPIAGSWRMKRRPA